MREANPATEGELVGLALRHDQRWLAAGLTAPPLVNVLTEPLWLSRPLGTRPGRLRAAWLFDLGVRKRPHVFAVQLDYGFDHDQDRLRRVAWVWLDTRRRATSLFDAARRLALAFDFSALRMSGLCTLERSSPHDFGAWLAAQALGQAVTFRGSGEAWRRLVHKDHTPPAGLAPSAAWPEVSLADARVLGAFGDGGWPAPRRVRRALTRGAHKRADAIPLDVRNPAIAHRHLLQSGALQRRFFFPEAGPIEEVDVLVVGAGLAGLTAAYGVQPRRALVLELEDRIAGTAAAGDGLRGPFALAAHYEHGLATHFDPEIIRLFQALGIAEATPTGQIYPFVDKQFLVDPARQEQFIAADGMARGPAWQMVHQERHRALAQQILAHIGQMPLPARLVKDELRALDRLTFAQWCQREQITLDPLLRLGIDTGFRSDYGGTANDVSAFAGLHYLTCRPYFTERTGTLSPPQGLCYFAERLLAHTPSAEVRCQHLVRRMVEHDSHVDVTVLDLRERATRRIRAAHVVFAAPKKSLKYIFPKDRPLFAHNVYAAWIVLTMELRALPEKAALSWCNAIYDPRAQYVGVTWTNHGNPHDPPILGHYLVFPPGKRHHATVWAKQPRSLVDFCLRQTRVMLGRDLSPDIERITIQKLGHAMPTPVPHSLVFGDVNLQRQSRRVLYAGVDTGRLPLLIEAMDSGLCAARLINSGEALARR